MKKICICLLILISVTDCLKAKRSGFDINGPGGFPILFGFIFFSNRSQSFSVGGNITGFTAGKLILQNNAGSDLNLDPKSNYSFNGISSGSAYAISVKTHPVGLACTLSNATGTVNGNITNVNIVCTSFVAKAAYDLGDPTNSFWLDYVRSNGTSPLNATGNIPCVGTETGFYNACIHAGEIKKFTIPNITSCSGIDATDSLSALNWRCVVENNIVNIYSTGLRGDKGLSDLIDFTSSGSWRNISLTITFTQNNTTTTLMQTSPAKWWDNVIVVRNTPGLQNTSQTIYINNGTNSVGSSYSLGTAKTALISDPNIVNPYSGASGAAIGVPAGTHFTWIEGSFQATNTAGVLSYTGGAPSRFNVVRNFKGIGNAINTINMQATSSFFHNVSGTNLDLAGTFLKNNQVKNVFNNITAYNVLGNGIELGSLDVILINGIAMSTANANNGIYVNASTSLLTINSTSANNLGNAIEFNTATRPTTINFLGTNSDTSPVFNYADALFTKAINTIVAHNSGGMLFNETGNDSSVHIGLTKFSGTGNCSIATGGGNPNPGLSNTTCAKQNGSVVPNSPISVTGITLANSFVGKVTSNDSKNTSDSLGTNIFPPTDWLNFENRFRGWGNDGGIFPLNTNLGYCAGTCRIWDWSLKANDTVARNVNDCPNGSIVDTHQWSVTNQAACNSEYKGAVFNVANSTCITTFLRNAVEIFGDGVGNENGICESNEECMYTPNIGAYQGHSSDTSNSVKLIEASQATATTSTCQNVTAGTVSNVKLWKFDTNGY